MHPRTNQVSAVTEGVSRGRGAGKIPLVMEVKVSVNVYDEFCVTLARGVM